MITPRPKSNQRLDPLAVVCWLGLGDLPVQSYPLPRPLAEEVARAYAAIYPRVTFWLEDIAGLPSEGRPAHIHVQRSRDLARTAHV